MPALLSERTRLTAPPATVQLSRTDISFANVSPERVAITVRVSNPGGVFTAPTVAVLSAAPLGAFVPWRRLATLRVPALAAGEAVDLTTSALLPRTAPLGPPDRVSPRRLLTALGAEDDRRGGRTLPDDLFRLLGRGGFHWAGNLNVFVGGKSVERHLAQALRVHPGKTNLAMFVVGSGSDAYRFRLEGGAVDWDAQLFDFTDGTSLRLDAGASEVAEGEWVAARGGRMFALALRPPHGCAARSVEVHVTRRSTGETAVVEFSLDPTAAGPGCYTV